MTHNAPDVVIERFFDVSLEPLCVLDAAGRLHRVNPAFERLVGANEIATEDALIALVHPDGREEVRAALALVRDGEPLRELSLHMRGADQDYRWIVCNAAHVPETDEIYVSLRDDTVRHAAALVLERTNRELEAFAYTTSHDLRAPLISIDGFAASLERRYGDVLDERGRDYVRRIRSNALALQTLISDLLEFARVSREIPMTIDADRLAREVVHAISRRVSGTETTVELDGELPTLVAHPDRFKQALTNLVENALVHAAGGGPVCVRVSAQARERFVDVAVEDDGGGVALAEQDKIFELFVRGRASSASAPGGTGVGLALAKSIAEASGGSARYEDAPGGGARFVLTFPQGGTA